MRRAFVLTGLALLAASCTTDRYAKLETATPTLSAAQIAELQKSAKTPEELGIQMRVTERSAEFAGVNVVEARENVTVPLVEIPTDRPNEPGGLYRAPVIH